MCTLTATGLPICMHTTVLNEKAFSRMLPIPPKPVQKSSLHFSQMRRPRLKGQSEHARIQTQASRVQTYDPSSYIVTVHISGIRGHRILAQSLTPTFKILVQKPYCGEGIGEGDTTSVQ